MTFELVMAGGLWPAIEQTQQAGEKRGKRSGSFDRHNRKRMAERTNLRDQ